MWFALTFPMGKADLMAAIALDGQLYFNVESEGRFLGYANPYQFAKNCGGTRDLNKHLPFGVYLRQRGKKRPILVYTFEEMLLCGKNARHPIRDPEWLKELWLNGRVDEPMCQPEFNSKCAPRLMVKDMGKSHCKKIQK